MKKKHLSIALLLGAVLCLGSCGTILTSSSQEITFTGESGIGIYDNGIKLTTINDEGIGIAKIKKRLSSKKLLAKKEGYKSTPISLDATLNPVSLLNFLGIFGWAVDAATGKCCKWSDDIIAVELEKADK